LLSIKKNGIAERKPTAASRPSANRQVVKFKTQGPLRGSDQPSNGQVQNQGRFAAVINDQTVKFKTNGGSQCQCPGFELIVLVVGELLGGWRTAR
jgi:hypothetical protein